MYSAQNKSELFHRVNDLPLSMGERLRINAYIQDGERIADLSSRALASLRAGMDFAGNSVKAMFAKPVRH